MKRTSKVLQVHLLSDNTQRLHFVTTKLGKAVSLMKNRVLKQFALSHHCHRFDLNKENRLLAVATGKPFSLDGSVIIWCLDNFTMVGEEKIGSILDVRFNEDGNKVIALTEDGAVYVISLQ